MIHRDQIAILETQKKRLEWWLAKTSNNTDDESPGRLHAEHALNHMTRAIQYYKKEKKPSVDKRPANHPPIVRVGDMGPVDCKRI